MTDEQPPEDVVRALCVWVGPEVPQEQIEAVVTRLRARKGVKRVEVLERKARRIAGASAPLSVVDEVRQALATQGYYDADTDPVSVPQAPQNDMDDDVCFCGCVRRVHRTSVQWGESCDGCSALGHMATYQWRHPFTRDVGIQHSVL